MNTEELKALTNQEEFEKALSGLMRIDYVRFKRDFDDDEKVHGVRYQPNSLIERHFKLWNIARNQAC